jgi:hypothetical protein
VVNKGRVQVTVKKETGTLKRLQREYENATPKSLSKNHENTQRKTSVARSDANATKEIERSP